MLETVVNAFYDNDRELIVRVIKERERIKKELETAANQEDFAQFMTELMKGLESHCGAIDILAKRFLQLVREDLGQSSKDDPKNYFEIGRSKLFFSKKRL